MALAFIASAPTSVTAQLAPGVEISPATKLRLTLVAPRDRFTGAFLSADRDSIRVDRGSRATYGFDNVRRLEVRGGRDRRRGALIGAGILGGVALVAGGIDVSRGNLSTGEWLGTIAGNALFGGLLGLALPPRGWVDVPLAR